MFGIAIYAAYGMTETVTHCITGKPQEQLPVRSMGHVTPGYEIAVVDKESGELCTDGQTGGEQVYFDRVDQRQQSRKGQKPARSPNAITSAIEPPYLRFNVSKRETRCSSAASCSGSRSNFSA